jgi:hypothetical protein
MDLPLFARVMKRHPFVVFVGVTLAIALSALTLLRVGTAGATYRQQQQWVSYTTLMVTQEGFPWGNLSGLSPQQIPYADAGRLGGLAVLYSQFVTSDPVRKIMLEQGPINGTLEAAAVPASKNSFSSDPLPFVRIAALSPSANEAPVLATRAADALTTYLEAQQTAAAIKPSARVLLQTSTAATTATLYKKRSKALPIVVLLSLLIATILVAFVVENVRAREDVDRSSSDEAPDTAGITQPA